MGVMTWRADDELLERARLVARAAGKSLNEWVTAVIGAATDPDLAGNEADKVRARLRLAGLLAEPEPGPAHNVPPARLAAARAAGGKGVSLSELVSEGRGPM